MPKHTVEVQVHPLGGFDHMSITSEEGKLNLTFHYLLEQRQSHSHA